MNVSVEGDWSGNYTYEGIGGCLVIDYTLITEDLRELIDTCEVHERTESDHQPIVSHWKTDRAEGTERSLKLRKTEIWNNKSV